MNECMNECAKIPSFSKPIIGSVVTENPKTYFGLITGVFEVSIVKFLFHRVPL